ncbi:MAG: hypothetical protein ACXVZU_05190 [Methanobacteriaceae archaeon]
MSTGKNLLVARNLVDASQTFSLISLNKFGRLLAKLGPPLSNSNLWVEMRTGNQFRPHIALIAASIAVLTFGKIGRKEREAL